MIQTLLVGSISITILCLLHYTALEGEGKHLHGSSVEGLLQHIICCIQGNNGLKNSYQPIPHIFNIEALIPQDLCFYTAYKPWELVCNYYLCFAKFLDHFLHIQCVYSPPSSPQMIINFIYYTHRVYKSEIDTTDGSKLLGD